jgi:hypothetical protein
MPIEPGSTRAIEIPGDTLVLDQQFCDGLGVSRRHAQKLDQAGLPYLIVGNKKYRPVREAGEWLAKRIVRKGQPQIRARRAR